MSTKQFSRIFEKIDNNPSEYKKLFTAIYEQVYAENFDAIENIVMQIHHALAHNARPQNKMFAIRLFKDLLPAASYGFMLYSQSYLINEIIKIIQFKAHSNAEDYQKYLFSNQPDTNLAHMGRSAYAMAVESLKFAAETMTLHPYQMISFPSIFRLQYNRLVSQVKFPQTYKFIQESQRTKFHSNYNSKIKNIESIIKIFESRLHSRMSFCLSQGNFEIKGWLIKFIYTGESNIIPFVLGWVMKQIQNPQISTSTKVEMMDFLNEAFVIGDIQIMNEFNNHIIPAMIQIVYPLDFKGFKILTNNQTYSENLRIRAKQCLSFWGQISPQSSQLLQCFSEKSPLLQGSRLYQSYAAFSQALELNIGYRNQINISKQKFLTSKNLFKHLALLNQFYSKYPMGNEVMIVEEKITTHVVPNIAFTHSEEFVYNNNMRTSQVIHVEESQSQTAINQLSMPGNSYLSKPSSAGHIPNQIVEQIRHHEEYVFPQPPVLVTQHHEMNPQQISFSESNISTRMQQLQNMNDNAKLKFLDKVEVMNYEVHNQQNPRIYMEMRNITSHISPRGPEVHVQEEVHEQIEFHDSYTNQQNQNNVRGMTLPKTLTHEYYEGDDKQYLPTEAIIKTVTKPQFGFPISISVPAIVQKTTVISQQPPTIRRVKSTQFIQPIQIINHTQTLQQKTSERNIDYFQNNHLIKFSKAQSIRQPNKHQMLRRSNSSSKAKGALFDLNESLRNIQPKPMTSGSYSPRAISSNQYQKRIKMLQNEVQTCFAVDQIHKQEMINLKQQLYDVNNKVQQIVSLQVLQPNIESVFIKNYQPVYKQTMQHIQVVQQTPQIVPPQKLVLPQQSIIRLPKQIQSWSATNPNSKLLNIPPIRISNRRKKQLMRNKEVLHRGKHCEVGFIMILKDYLEITVYYYFSHPSTQFRTQLVSPDLNCFENTNFSYIPHVDANTQKKQSFRFLYPNVVSLPFKTPEIVVSFQSMGAREEFKVILPCILLKFLTTVEKSPPFGHFNSYHSCPFIINALFQKYQNLAELLPGLMPLSSANATTQYGVECCYQESTVYIKLIFFKDSFTIIQLYELRSSSSHQNLINTILQDLISILSTDL